MAKAKRTKKSSTKQNFFATPMVVEPDPFDELIAPKPIDRLAAIIRAYPSLSRLVAAPHPEWNAEVLTFSGLRSAVLTACMELGRAKIACATSTTKTGQSQLKIQLYGFGGLMVKMGEAA